MKTFIYVSLLLFTFVFCTQSQHPDQQSIITSPDTSDEIREILLSNSIIPEVLDDFSPTYTINLTYTSKHDHFGVDLGNTVPVHSLKTRPTFMFLAVNDSEILPKQTTFTLVLADPDAKSRQNPKWSEMCHWIMTNLTLTRTGVLVTTANDDISPNQQTETDYAERLPGELVPYKPPTPPKKTGPHRYVFVVLAKPQGGRNVLPPKERKHWGYGENRRGVRDWAEENELEVVGVNFLFAEYDKK